MRDIAITATRPAICDLEGGIPANSPLSPQSKVPRVRKTCPIPMNYHRRGDRGRRALPTDRVYGPPSAAAYMVYQA